MPARRKFEFIHHTADIGVRADGRNLSEAFNNAAYGLFSIMTDLRKVRKVESRDIELRGNNIEDLLFEWLNHLIYLFDTQRMLFKLCDVLEFDANRIKAVCYGEKVDPARHHIKIEVKAATYHMLEIDQQKNQVQVIFDI